MIRTLKAVGEAWKILISVVVGLGILVGAAYAVIDTHYATQAQTREMMKEFTACIERIKEKDIEQDKLDAAAIYKIELLASDIRGTLKEIKVELRNMRKDK